MHSTESAKERKVILTIKDIKFAIIVFCVAYISARLVMSVVDFLYQVGY